MIYHATIQTPVGMAFAARSERGLVGLYFVYEGDLDPAFDRLEADYPSVEKRADPDRLTPVLDAIQGAIERGEPVDDVPLDLRGTPFQLRVWEALRQIPRGTTTTYGALTASLGLVPGAARAVGAACGANPVSLFVPCHRVITSTGALRGYRWGIERKRALLLLEGARAIAPTLPFDETEVAIS